METVYKETAPARTEIDALQGAALLEFGTNWCGYCRAALPLLAQAYQGFEQVPHFKVEDGPGRVLGRSFRVKLWPTLIFLRDGKEVARVVRPDDADEIIEGFTQATQG
jgi:thioredoxin 1